MSEIGREELFIAIDEALRLLSNNELVGIAFAAGLGVTYNGDDIFEVDDGNNSDDVDVIKPTLNRLMNAERKLLGLE